MHDLHLETHSRPYLRWSIWHTWWFHRRSSTIFSRYSATTQWGNKDYMPNFEL